MRNLKDWHSLQPIALQVISTEDKAERYGNKTPPILDRIEVDHWLVEPLHDLMGIFDSVSKAHTKY